MSDPDLFQQKLKEFESLIWYAAKRYTLDDGVFSTEDLYQEGLIILDSIFTKYEEYICGSESDTDFSKLFKTELWHGLANILKYNKRQMRYSSKNISIDQNDETFFAEEDQDTPNDLEENQSIKELIEKLLQRFDEDEKVVFMNLLNPRTWDDISSEFKTNIDGDEYWRIPSRPPQHVIANMLGWSHTYYKRTLRKVRQVVKQVGEEQNLDLVASVVIFKRKGRCRV